MLDGAMDTPRSLSMFIGLTSGSAKRVVWQVFQDINRQHDLGCKFNELELLIKLPNGSRIWLAGVPDRPSIERFRGVKLRRVAIDEAGAIPPYLRDLVSDVLEPALVDLDGDLILAGTPGVACTGMFYDITYQGQEGWPVYKWTILDNPHIPHARDWLEQRRERYGWTKENPTYRREWLGEWVHDDSDLVLPFDPISNGCKHLPHDQPWEYGIGIDLGYKDSTAFVITAVSPHLPEVYIVESYKRQEMIPSRVAEELLRLIDIYEPGGRIVIDAGGLGKGYLEEIKQRYHIPAKAAEKREKANYARLLAGDLKNGKVRIVVPKNQALIDEMAVFRWNEDHSKIEDGQEDHLCHGFLYGWRDTKHFESQPKKIVHDRGTKAYWDEEEKIMFEQEVEKLAQENKPLWDDLDRPW